MEQPFNGKEQSNPLDNEPALTREKKYFLNINQKLMERFLLKQLLNNPHLCQVHTQGKGAEVDKEIVMDGETGKGQNGQLKDASHGHLNGFKALEDEKGSPLPQDSQASPISIPVGMEQLPKIFMGEIKSSSDGTSKEQLFHVFDFEKKIRHNVFNRTLLAMEQQSDIPAIIPAVEEYLSDTMDLRAVGFHQDKICLAWDDRLMILDKNFNLIGSHSNHYLKNCQDLSVSGNRLFLTSAGFDSILVYDFLLGKFVEGYHVRYNKTANHMDLAPFNSESEKGPSKNNSLKLKNIFIHNNRLYFSSLQLRNIFYVEESGALHPSVSLAPGITYFKPYKNGFFMDNPMEQRIDHVDAEGRSIEYFEIPDSVKSKNLENFVTAICVIDDDVILVASPTATLWVYRSGRREAIHSMDFSTESRSAMNSFSIWPF